MDLIVTAVAVVAGAYVVMFTLLYGGRRLSIAGRIGMRGWVALLLSPLLVGFVMTASSLDGRGDTWRQ